MVNKLKGIEEYYSSKIKKNGASAEGVDWNGAESQFLRFEKLCKIIEKDKEFSINDMGCGYGAIIDYLDKHNAQYKYFGNDISAEMIDKARVRYLENTKVEFSVSDKPKAIVDYSVASGIFNVALDADKEEWYNYILMTLDQLNNNSQKGFSFNCLTSYSDEEKKRSYLYYANPLELFDYCKKKYSRNVALLHDYNLYEFTILVRKV